MRCPLSRRKCSMVSGKPHLMILIEPAGGRAVQLPIPNNNEKIDPNTIPNGKTGGDGSRLEGRGFDRSFG